jgi:hypothetical protein
MVIEQDNAQAIFEIISDGFNVYTTFSTGQPD